MKGGLGALRDAFSFLTLLPVGRLPDQLLGGPERMCRAMAWFPLVGACLGLAAGWVVLLAGRAWASPLDAWAGLAVLVILTGGLHLDGFSDTLDGMAAWGNREETLRVMQDSRLGGMGAVGLILLLGFKGLALAEVAPQEVLGALAASCSLSRLSLVISAQSFPYVPGRDGLGRLATDRRSAGVLLWAVLLGAGFALAAVGPARAGACLGLAGLLCWGLNQLFVARLGGITGDTLGAVQEVTETGLLLFLAMSHSVELAMR